MGKYCVYKHTAPNGKVYIGITRKSPVARWRKDGSGYKTSPHFYSAIEKYGWENFIHEILETNLSKEEACAEEKRLIQEYGSFDRKFGYNSTFGGDEGLKITPEIRKKISESNKRFYASPQARERISKARTGCKHTEEAKRKMSAAKRGTHYVMTEERRQNISKGQRKRLDNDPLYRENRAQIWANIGRSHAKKVSQYSANGEFIRTYESAHAAQRNTGIKNGNISKCCNGKAKSAGGYIWRYAS